MTSLYAALFVALGDARLAMAAQLGLALALAAGLLLAAAIMAGTLMSPYGYDYGLPIAGAALALLMPDLIGQQRRIGLPLLLLAWLACLAGSLTRMAMAGGPLPAVQFVPVLLLFAALLMLARRNPAVD